MSGDFTDFFLLLISNLILLAFESSVYIISIFYVNVICLMTTSVYASECSMCTGDECVFQLSGKTEHIQAHTFTSLTGSVSLSFRKSINLGGVTFILYSL